MAVHLPHDAPPPRLCILIKNTPTDEYGYNLHAEKGKQQFIGTVDENSPAARAGLCPGDRIYAVNGQSIVGESHRQVVQKIKEDPLKCELLVISEAGAEWYKEHNIPITLSLPNIIRVTKEESEVINRTNEINSGSPTPATWYTPKEAEKANSAATLSSASESEMSVLPRPRLCILRKERPENEFGFNLHAEKGGGHFVGAVDKGSIGERAGLCIGQRIVGVNQKLIYPSTPHREVVALIKENPLVTELLVASEEVDRWYANNHTEYSFQNAEVYSPLNATGMENNGGGSGDASVVHAQNQIDETLSRSTELPTVAIPTTAITTNTSNSNTITTPNAHQQIDELSGLDDDKVNLTNEEKIRTNTIEKTEELPARPLGEDVPTKGERFPPPRTSVNDNYSKSITSNYQQQNTHERNGSITANGVDIFSLNAEEARNRLVHRKKDPRLDTNMSIEEKHRLIANM